MNGLARTIQKNKDKKQTFLEDYEDEKSGGKK